MKTRLIGYLAATFIAIAGCQQLSDGDITPSRDVQIINDEATLSSRMLALHDTVFTSPQHAGGRTVRHFRLILKASLAPPQINGKSLQATALQDHWGGYLVSYNYQGEEYLGGVDFVDANLKVQSEILYNDADIHSLTAHDRYVYLTGAKQGQATPAYVERVLLNGMKFSLTDNIVVPLGSYAATSALQHQGEIYVTTGNDATNGGGLYQLDRDLNLKTFTALHDARWVFGQGGEVYVAQGTPGKVSGYKTNKMELTSTYSFDGANVPEAKTTIEVDSKRIFVAAGTKGVQVLYVKSGELLHTLTFGDGVITNAVSAQNGLLFISNGEAGAWVAQYDEGNHKEAPEVLGKIDVAAGQSVNHVLFRNYRLWIASGLGGVQQVDIEIW